MKINLKTLAAQAQRFIESKCDNLSLSKTVASRAERLEISIEIVSVLCHCFAALFFLGMKYVFELPMK